MKYLSTKNVVIVVILVLCIGKFCINMIWSGNITLDDTTAETAITIINDSDEVIVRKNYRSILKRQYYIIVDDTVVATVTGETLPIFGDVFTLASTNGEIIASEKEEVLHLNRQAQFFDANNNKTYRYESKIFTLLDCATLKDGENELLTSKQQFNIILTLDLLTNNENVGQIRKDFWFDNYTIDNDSDIDNTNVVLMTCINDAVSTSKNSSSSSSSNSSN